ncbi:hypothetical protein DPMN_044756 [Dreissena polymorpha]|uniref:Uncharacterized protein n=1 Tax=Dreissena polymorpha TaxID=45954 RepID=A0A9D4HZ09_DREPO|nr:hypothetical protein DPMN_044756 [Dreissena polymorpha]
MIQRPMAHCTTRCPYGQLAAIEQVTRSVTELCRLVSDLVKCWEDVVCELYFCYGGRPRYC